jgi:anti-anti-sigma regulatory factor
MTTYSVTATHSITAERGALVSVTGRLDTAAMWALRAQLDAAASDPGLDYVAVDLSGAARAEPMLFAVLADTDTRLRARAARLVVIGLGAEVLASLDEASLWAVFTLYRASRQRLAPPSQAAGDSTPGVDAVEPGWAMTAAQSSVSW